MGLSIGGDLAVSGWGEEGWLFLCWWSILVSFPAGTDLLFFVLPKKSRQKKGAPEMAKRFLEFMSQGGEGKNSLRSDSFPSFFLPATEIQGAI
ncbi:hypothetical protein FUT88_23190 [Ralstonia sp. TCR112]|nr:hypothetical protein FUT88_23190 [Ralstonia sp. TCR112]